MQLFRNRKLLCYILLIITGCEKDNVDVEGCTDPNALNYNIAATVQDESCEYEVGAYTQPMPSIITSSKILVSQYNSILFDEITTLPDNIEWLSDTTIMSHGMNVEYEVLDYWYVCDFSSHNHPDDHEIHVSNVNYLIKDKFSDDIFKLHFETYFQGVVSFKYANLNGENQTTVGVVTSDCYKKPFYYNFITNMEDSTNWHISLQKISVEF